MNCNFCNTELKIINFGTTPVSGYKVNNEEESLSQPFFPLDMTFCPNCNFAQYKSYDGIDEVLTKMYEQQEATYSISNNISLYIDHLANELIKKYNLSKASNILEIGCNDGSLLYSFKEKIKCNLIGVEPSKQFKGLWEEREITVINDFFSPLIMNKLHKRYDIITIRHVLEHISDVKTIIQNISNLMDNKSTLIIEVPYLKTVINKRRVENISLPHVNCFSIKSINEVISKYGLGIKEYKLVETDGGSIVFHIQKNIKTDTNIIDNTEEEEFHNLKAYINSRRNEIISILVKYKKEEVIGFGAGAKGQLLIQFFDLEKYINCVIDSNERFENQYIPGTSLIIKTEEMLNDKKIKAVINLAPTHSKQVNSKIPNHLDFINIIES